MRIRDILTFWFIDTPEDKHFEKDFELDKEIKKRFLSIHSEIVDGQHKDWEETARGCLAVIIVLDQFSRNMFRDTAQAFAYDDFALQVAEHAVELGFDQELPQPERAFIYMPYMHSEDPEVHARALQLFSSLSDEAYLKYEILHKNIIDRFDRYPHRNKVLGRESTDEELEFLQKENSSF